MAQEAADQVTQEAAEGPFKKTVTPRLSSLSQAPRCPSLHNRHKTGGMVSGLEDKKGVPAQLVMWYHVEITRIKLNSLDAGTSSPLSNVPPPQMMSRHT